MDIRLPDPQELPCSEGHRRKDKKTLWDWAQTQEIEEEETSIHRKTCENWPPLSTKRLQQLHGNNRMTRIEQQVTPRGTE